MIPGGTTAGDHRLPPHRVQNQRPRLRTGRSALLGGWDAHRATGGRARSGRVVLHWPRTIPSTSRCAPGGRGVLDTPKPLAPSPARLDGVHRHPDRPAIAGRECPASVRRAERRGPGPVAPILRRGLHQPGRACDLLARAAVARGARPGGRGMGRCASCQMAAAGAVRGLAACLGSALGAPLSSRDGRRTGRPRPLLSPS